MKKAKIKIVNGEGIPLSPSFKKLSPQKIHIMMRKRYGVRMRGIRI